MAGEDGPPIGELLERWVAGDRAAAEEIYRRYYARAWRFGIKLTGRETDADDVAQQALMAGLEGIRGGKRPDSFTGWIMGIARHTANQRWEKDRRERSAIIGQARVPASRSSPATRMIGQEMGRLLQDVLGKLDPRDRELVRLRLEQKVRRKEVAARLGLPPTTLDRQMERVLAHLREELSRHFTTLVLPRVAGAEKSPLTLDAVARLRPSFRQAVELRCLEGLSAGEAGARLGVPPETVEARLRHALDQLGCDPDGDFSAAQAEYRSRIRR